MWKESLPDIGRRHLRESSVTRRALNWTGQSACQVLCPSGGGQLAKKIKARDVLPQGSSGHCARLPLETGECLSAGEHNAPVAAHTQLHQGGIAYGANVPEYLANTWFLCSECAFHTGIGFRETIAILRRAC